MNQSKAIPLHVELSYLHSLVPSCPGAKFILCKLLTKLWKCPREENLQKNN